MFDCYLTNIKTKEVKALIGPDVEVNDNEEFSLTIRVNRADIGLMDAPEVFIGDVRIDMYGVDDMDESTAVYNSTKKSFFDNAFFLNYFGECEISISIGEFRRSFVVNVNVTGYKGSVAREMLLFLSENADDVLQTCYSKARIGFSHKSGGNRDFVKLAALEKAMNSIEELFSAFKINKKYNVEHRLEYYTNKPTIVDETGVLWLSENMDQLEISNSVQCNIKVNNKNYKINLPNSISYFDTSLKENYVLHDFSKNSLGYLKSVREKTRLQIKEMSSDMEYGEYIKFDQVIKGIINPILEGRIEKIDKLIFRIKKIKLFFEMVLPVKKISRRYMPVQTAFTLKHRHYAIVFNEIAVFYKSTDAERTNSEFLLGLRNLSQVFELCCLYYIVNYFNGIAVQKRAVWASDSLSFIGNSTEKVNVLANEFLFENDGYEYTLLYEKKFYSLSKSDASSQEHTLVRVDKESNHYSPDFTIKVFNKLTGSYYFIIMDAKFSRRYKMMNKSLNDAPSVLQSVYQKYAMNLRVYDGEGIVNKTNYVGVLFGLSQHDGERKRVNMFNKSHDTDGIAPMFPFAAADFISFSDDHNNGTVFDKYIEK